MGNLYSMSRDHTLTKQLDQISISNGMDWTDDNSVMFYIDSVPRKVYAFDFDLAAGTISRSLVQTSTLQLFKSVFHHKLYRYRGNDSDEVFGDLLDYI